MPAHLRVSVADRAGSLAALTAALSRAGANVLSVTVLERDQGRAVDDLLLDWPYARPWDELTRAIEDCPGLRIHGIRHVAVAAATSELDLVRQAAEQPLRAVETVLDGLPHVLLADWAAAFDRSDAFRSVASSSRTSAAIGSATASSARCCTFSMTSRSSSSICRPVARFAF